MQKNELVNIAQKLGKQISDVQIKNWIRAGLIPSPKRINNGKVGSNYTYSEIARSNLELILSSCEYNKNIKKLTIDIWFRGGIISKSHLTEIIDYELEIIEKPIRKVAYFVPKLEKYLKHNCNNEIKKLFLLPKTSLPDKLTTLNVMINAMSPNGNPEIWRNHLFSDIEISSAEIAAKSTGFDNLYEGSDEALWDEIYNNISIKNLRKSLRTIQNEDLQQIRIYAMHIIEFIEKLNELAFFQKRKSIFFILLFKINNRYKLQCYLLIIIIHLYKRKAERNILEDFVKETYHMEKELNFLVGYVKHMRKHQYLKKKKIWDFKNLDEELFKSLKSHQQIYLDTYTDGNINYK